MKKVAILLFVFTVGLTQTQAQWGKKLLSKKNLKKGLKVATGGASLGDEGLKTLSKQVVEFMDKKNKVAAAKYVQRLEKLTSKHVAEDGLELNFKAYDSADVNIVCTMDGSIRVNSGLMDLLDDEELLSVVGNQIGHIKNLDAKKSMKTAYISAAKSAAMNLAGGATSKKKGDKMFSDKDMSTLVNTIAKGNFSEEEVKVASKYSADFMAKNKYTYKGAEAAKKLAK